MVSSALSNDRFLYSSVVIFYGNGRCVQNVATIAKLRITIAK